MASMERAARYRKIALSFPGAEESSHMGAADFRVHDRIFATLAYEAKGLGTLKITPEQQAEFIADAPEWFEPAPGGWGRMGMTLVKLDAPEDVLRGGLETAYRNVVAKTAKRAAKKRT
ncbi:MAG: MmcQ/YjbR family DNA-binding protein [Acidobacteria bacterium]|nr:MmcQ/YjbR family DNA-binding protein [Acidobacteriota bacterium]